MVLVKYIYVPKEIYEKNNLKEYFSSICKCKIQGQEYYIFYYTDTKMFLAKFSKEDVEKLVFRNVLIFT